MGISRILNITGSDYSSCLSSESQSDWQAGASMVADITSLNLDLDVDLDLDLDLVKGYCAASSQTPQLIPSSRKRILHVQV